MPETKEWTLMFYFASDNPLAPGIISQLKALKYAGYHPEANVIARFDSHPVDTPAHIFDVNLYNKLKARGEPNVGFLGNDSYVRSLILDRLWEEEETRERIRESLNNNGAGNRRGTDAASIDYDPPVPTAGMSGEQSPRVALRSFLDFCQREYPARRYMLFILGHGLVVGNDLFLFDEHIPQQPISLANGDDSSTSTASKEKRDAIEESPAQHSLLLTDLGAELRRFKENLEKDSEFELVGFHSCSMSSLEVAYELQDTANYMLASQGPAYVGNWPYRQILIHVFNKLEKKREEGVEINVQETLGKIFAYCMYNSHDFQLAGYPFDLCLCDLNKVSKIKAPLNELSSTLIDGLADPLAQGVILLAHWEAQSYWQETYTDLYDFCFCLLKRYKELKPTLQETSATLKALQAIEEKCDKLMGALERGVENDDKIIVRSAFSGPAYQYSNGLSIFFPWSKPVGNQSWNEQYGQYKLIEESENDETSQSSWRKFLEKYFDLTMRKPRATEYRLSKQPAARYSLTEDLLEEIATLTREANGQLNKGGSGDRTGVGGSKDPAGGDCGCPSIKNYPPLTRSRREDNNEDA